MFSQSKLVENPGNLVFRRSVVKSLKYLKEGLTFCTDGRNTVALDQSAWGSWNGTKYVEWMQVFLNLGGSTYSLSHCRWSQ